MFLLDMLMKRVIVDRKMFIQPTRKTWRGKSYTRYLVVRSVRTPQGPRHPPQVPHQTDPLNPPHRSRQRACHARLGPAHGPGRHLAERFGLPVRRGLVPYFGSTPSPAGSHRGPTGGPRAATLSTAGHDLSLRPHLDLLR